MKRAKRPPRQAKILDFNSHAKRKREQEAERADSDLKAALCEKLLKNFPLDRQLANLICTVVDSDVSSKAVAAIIETL